MQIQQTKQAAGRKVGFWTLKDFMEVFKNMVSLHVSEGLVGGLLRSLVVYLMNLKVLSTFWFCGHD